MLCCDFLSAQYIAQSLIGGFIALLTITIPIIIETYKRRKERKRQMLEKMYGELLAAMDFVILECDRYNVARVAYTQEKAEEEWRKMWDRIMPYVYKVQVILSQGELVFAKNKYLMLLQKQLEAAFSFYINEANITDEVSNENFNRLRKELENEVKTTI